MSIQAKRKYKQTDIMRQLAPVPRLQPPSPGRRPQPYIKPMQRKNVINAVTPARPNSTYLGEEKGGSGRGEGEARVKGRERGQRGEMESLYCSNNKNEKNLGPRRNTLFLH